MSNGQSPDKIDGKGAVALIAGPTASGKSDLAVELGLEIERRGRRAVVINADSAQVYRDLRVLSARPSEEDMRGIDHRLFGAWDGADACSAADWANAAAREIEAAHATGAVPTLVGGTGLYLRTLLDGIAPVPPINPAVREAVRALPTSDAYAALLTEDPERAGALNAADSTRIARALEVVRSTGKPLSHWQARREGGIGQTIELFPLVLLLDRRELYRRCDQRFERMIEHGAAEEVQALLARRLDPALPVMRAIGVQEIAGWLQSQYRRDEAVSRGQQATRNYAKRQYTWFRHQPPMAWPRATETSYLLERQFATLLRRYALT